MNANPQKSLRKITIEEFDFLFNPALLRDMFVPEVKNDPFLCRINVGYIRSPRKSGEICGVELTGPPDALRKFVDKFLKDENPHAYSLE
jgi:hypothetical protein